MFKVGCIAAATIATLVALGASCTGAGAESETFGSETCFPGGAD
jgi:hypothetical protein